jgi:chromatin assembly factor 1 subunit B
MRAEAIEIAWHDEASIWSVDCSRSGRRLVTAGGDKVARVWRYVENLHACLGLDSKIPEQGTSIPSSSSPEPHARTMQHEDGPAKGGRRAVIEWLCDLSAHTTTVNVARFSPDGERIATAADQGEIVLWYLGGPIDNDRDDKPRERWTQAHVIRGHSFDVLDLSWSPDGNRIASASVDNSIRLWDTSNPKRLPANITHHDSLVQGVAFDPLSRFIASLGSDRALAVYSLATSKSVVSAVATTTEPKSYYFASDTKCSTVFRRLAWSPDGSFLVCPSGLEVPNVLPCRYSIHIFSRGVWTSPALQCTGLTKIPTAVAFCPVIFSRKFVADKVDSCAEVTRQELFLLPYRMIFAVAGGDSVLIFDTECSTRPIAYLAGLHYAEVTDLAWGPDGKALFVSSTDGCVSIVSFEDDELGVPLASENLPDWMQHGSSGQVEMPSLSSASALEPVTPLDPGSCTENDGPRSSTTPGGLSVPEAKQTGGGPGGCNDGVREVFVVVPRRKQCNGSARQRTTLAEDDPTRKRLKLDEL